MDDASDLFFTVSADHVLKLIGALGDDKAGLSGPGERNVQGSNVHKQEKQSDCCLVFDHLIIVYDIDCIGTTSI